MYIKWTLVMTEQTFSIAVIDESFPQSVNRHIKHVSISYRQAAFASFSIPNAVDLHGHLLLERLGTRLIFALFYICLRSMAWKSNAKMNDWLWLYVSVERLLRLAVQQCINSMNETQHRPQEQVSRTFALYWPFHRKSFWFDMSKYWYHSVVEFQLQRFSPHGLCGIGIWFVVSLLKLNLSIRQLNLCNMACRHIPR